MHTLSLQIAGGSRSFGCFLIQLPLHSGKKQSKYLLRDSSNSSFVLIKPSPIWKWPDFRRLQSSLCQLMGLSGFCARSPNHWLPVQPDSIPPCDCLNFPPEILWWSCSPILSIDESRCRGWRLQFFPHRLRAVISKMLFRHGAWLPWERAGPAPSAGKRNGLRQGAASWPSQSDVVTWLSCGYL